MQFLQNQFNMLEMIDMNDMPSYIISQYKDTVWKKQMWGIFMGIDYKTVTNSIDFKIRFYVYHIFRRNSKCIGLSLTTKLLVFLYMWLS